MVFWIGLIGVPLLLVFCSSALRCIKGTPFTSSIDALNILIAFDTSIILDPALFVQFVSSSSDLAIATKELTASIVFLAIIAIIMWVVSILELESALAAHYDNKSRGNPTNFPVKSWVTIWCLTMVLLAVHIAIFTKQVNI